MYASHNSFTAYPVRKWYMRLLQIFAKCQNVSIGRQRFYGVEVFDIRVRIGENGKLIPCHGLVEYDADVENVIKYLENVGLYYRIVLENKIGGNKTSEQDLYIIKEIFISDEYPHCLYVSDKKDWNTTRNPYCKRQFKEKNEHGGTFCLIPRLWVRKFKKYKDWRSKNYDQETIFWYDFVEIK